MKEAKQTGSESEVSVVGGGGLSGFISGPAAETELEGSLPGEIVRETKVIEATPGLGG